MAAEPSRRPPKSSGLIVRPQAVSDKSYVESVVGFINEVVPQTSVKQGDKESVLWVKFDYCDINDYSLIREEAEHNANHPSLLIILGYTSGVQIWCVPASGEAQEVLSWREGPVKFLKVLPTPELVENIKDRFSSARPLVAICDSTSAGEPFCSINFLSLKSGDTVECLRFSNQISDFKCVKRMFAVVFPAKIIVYNTSNLKEILVVTSCYTAPGLAVNPIALGTRWLAFANRKLVPVHQSGGGMAGDGVQSYAATIIHAAKTISKGLSIFGETVANSLGAGQKLASKPVRSDPKATDDSHPGIVTIIDALAVHGEVSLDEDSDEEGIIAHFPAHANEPVAAMEFDPSGMLLFTSCRLGHSFHIFRIFPHPASPAMGAVHHLYTLHRGETTSKVQDIAFSLDSRWVSVSTMRGTTHVFPITPYGGPISVRTHTSPRVVNRLSRFHRSAGLEEIQQTSNTGRNSPVLSGSPSSSGSNLSRAFDAHPSMAYHASSLSRMGNSRLGPYPHPTTIQPLAQLKQGLTFPLTSAPKPKSPSGKDRVSKRKTSVSDIMCIASAFAPPRAWLVGSPSLTRDKRDKPSMDSLFIIDFHGNLTEYILEPKPASASPKTDDSPIELDVIIHAQWNLLRPVTSPEIHAPLPNTNPLMFTPDSSHPPDTGRSRKASGEVNLLSRDNTPTELEESWLSEVEIITHAGPHRRLWMGPQFSFQTFQQNSNTTVLSSNSSALLSQSPETHGTLTADIFTEELEVQSLRPARSNPMAMPGSHQATSGSPGSLMFIEAGSGSFEQLPNMLEVCGSWPDNFPSMTPNRGREDKLKESLADAMSEDPFDCLRNLESRNLQGSCEELSSCSSHSGSVSHAYDGSTPPQGCMDHSLVFPSSRGSSESSS